MIKRKKVGTAGVCSTPEPCSKVWTRMGEPREGKPVWGAAWIVWFRLALFSCYFYFCLVWSQFLAEENILLHAVSMLRRCVQNCCCYFYRGSFKLSWENELELLGVVNDNQALISRSRWYMMAWKSSEAVFLLWSCLGQCFLLVSPLNTRWQHMPSAAVQILNF